MKTRRGTHLRWSTLRPVPGAGLAFALFVVCAFLVVRAEGRAGGAFDTAGIAVLVAVVTVTAAGGAAHLTHRRGLSS